jgi:predicted lipoprotein with Yx(FWY)xxD motif
MNRTFGVLTAALTLALLLAACGGGDSNNSASTKARTSTTASSGASSSATSSPTTTVAAPATTAQAATVMTANSSLGTILVNVEGKTLYAFANDQGTTSACTGGCATIWPPLMASGTPVAGNGVDGSKLSAAPSGQVAYNGHLLYTYAQDMAAGDTKGQGIGGIWHVVSPSGEPIT